ncbi:MAG: hypothetical protein K2F74_01190, partial [Muribaculaceae bacterium]|nr:hypothetical protein [Muribaculaceae bacterium]
MKNKYLLVVYQNLNMDAIYDDGRVVNMPEILNANLAVSKTMTSINMQDDYISISTNFGYVIYDAAKLVVKESRNWGSSIRSVTVWRGNVVILDNLTMLYAPMDSNHASISDFKKLRGGAAADLLQVMGDAL